MVPEFFDIQEPVVLMNELKKIVKELKERNPNLRDYKLMNVGFTSNHKLDISQMRFYFIKKSH